MCISLALMLWMSVDAQHPTRLDSMVQRLPEISGVEKYNLLNEIGFQYRLSNPDSTIYYCSLAYELGKQLELKRNLSRPLSFIGLANAYKGNYKESFEYHTRAVEIAIEQQDSSQLAYSYNNFGRLFFDQGDLTRAYDYLLRSRILFEQLNDPIGLAYVYRSLATMYRSQKDYEKALPMAVKAYELRKQQGEGRSIFSALMELGTVYSEMNNTFMADQCFEQADSIAGQLNDKLGQAEVRISWAEFLISNKDTTRSHHLAHETFKMVSEAKNVRLLPRANLIMGRIHLELNGLEAASQHLKDAISLTENKTIQCDAYLYLSKVFEKQNRHSEANAAFAKYLDLKESLQSIELTRQIEKLQFQLEIERIERENALLKSSEAKNDETIRQQQIQGVILAVSVVFISILLFLQWKNVKKNKAINEKLRKQNAKIEKQRLEIIEKNDKLKRHNKSLSDLNQEKDTLMNIVAHDLKSPLNRIKALAELIKMEGQLNTGQEKFLGLVKDSTRSGLDLIVDLLDVNALEANREPNYTFFELSTVLKDRLNAYQHYASAKNISFTNNVAYSQLLYLDHDYLTRIVDNLISNAVKFSPPGSRVSISTQKNTTSFSISITDQGPGFSEMDQQYLYQKFKKLSARPTGGESSNGLGLAIVKILVERLGGSIQLQTEEGKGSTFTVELPIKTA